MNLKNILKIFKNKKNFQNIFYETLKMYYKIFKWFLKIFTKKY